MDSKQRYKADSPSKFILAESSSNYAHTRQLGRHHMPVISPLSCPANFLMTITYILSDSNIITSDDHYLDSIADFHVVSHAM